jgi:hypothetical protein
MKQVVLIWTGLVVLQSVFAQPGVPKKKFHLYLLVGQSNMAGRGSVEAGDTVTNKCVWMLTKEDGWKPAKEPLHFDKPSAAGTGPGLMFGRLMAEVDTNVVIGLIPCAVGGTSINLWKKGNFDSVTKTHPYADAIKRASMAMKTGTLKGILWHQGESDSDSLKAYGYSEKLVDLVKRFREDLCERKVLFVAGTIAEFYTARHPYAKSINESIEALPLKTKNVMIVSSSGLAHKGDNTHFDSASARELGRRYAKAVKKFYGFE